MLVRISKLVATYYEEPNNVMRIRHMLSKASQEIILLMEVLDYLNESLSAFKVPERPEDEVGSSLFETLHIDEMLEQIRYRCQDLRKLVQGCDTKLTILQSQATVVNKCELFSK